MNNERKQKIIVESRENEKNKSRVWLRVYEGNEKLLETEAFVGRNGIGEEKVEGDEKTPKGNYKLGITFGIYKKEEIELDKDIYYQQINENLYWVDDSNSQYYNQMVDSEKIKKDWSSAEHLIDYKIQYEYAIEIKTNPQRIPGKRKCYFFTL